MVRRVHTQLSDDNDETAINHVGSLCVAIEGPRQGCNFDIVIDSVVMEVIPPGAGIVPVIDGLIGIKFDVNLVSTRRTV